MRLASKPIGWPLAAALAAGCLATTALVAPATAKDVAKDEGPAPAVSSQTFQVNTGRGRLVTLSRPMSDLFVADESIADVQVRSPTQLYIFGKKAGETNISATSKSGAVVYATVVRVGNNFDSIGHMLSLAMPEAQVVATPMNGLVLLTGTVAAPDDAAEAERLVQAFVGEGTKVLSRLKTATPLQVNLQVRIAEVSRTFAKNIGNRLNTRDGPGDRDTFLFASDSGKAGTIEYDPVTGAKTSTYQVGPQRSTLGIAGRLLGTNILSAIDLGETIGQVTTLANPNLTALSGETGTFLAGGEIPIPLSQGLGAVSVEFKQYGISLAYTPIVLSDGRISLRVRPEVSQLSYSAGVQLGGTVIPGLTTRRAETTVELGSGQSLVIGGLMSNNHDNNIEKTPGLGNVPILGALFRSNGFRRSETELMIVITPYLVKPVNANDIVLPTDGYKTPSDLDRVFLGTLARGESGAERPKPTVAPAQPPVTGAVTPFPSTPGAVSPRLASRPKKGAPAPGFSN